ncbi:MAG: DUF58 domain-containing protein [Planctomycetota bacterium]|nr:DUF58 domain-containing protein [Planctomycetota bacterium]
MRPTAVTLLLFLIGFPLAVLPVMFDPDLWVFWLIYLGGALLVLGVDALLAMSPRRLHVEIETPDAMMIGGRGTMQMQLLMPRGVPPVRIEVLPELGETLAPQPAQKVEARAGETIDVDVELVPVRRGQAEVQRAWLRWTSPFGLVERQKHVPIDRHVPVEPNVNAVRSTAMAFFAPHEFASGLKVERYVGDGTEFDSLREYVPGLDSRAISWRATARHRKLICQDYRAERNHSVILALDTGHLMSEPMGGIPKLDHGVTAALVLAYMGLHTGDRVGLFAFDSKVRTYAEPQGGVHAFPRLRRLTADLAYSASETNFTLGLAELSARLRRRSLIVLLTDFVDTVTAELMLDNVHRLARRHLVLFVTLRDPELLAIAERDPDRVSGLYESVVAGDFVREREVVLARLRRMGCVCIDVAPQHVSTRMLNQYLEIKRRELI